MRTSVLSLGALALGVAAHEYPNCEADGCYRNLIDPRFAEEAVAWCPQFLAGTTTAAAAVPTNFGNCDGDIAAISSACSCVTYTATATETSSEAPATSTVTDAPTTVTPPPTTSTEESSSECETETETESEEPETSTTKWTTSTITTSTTKTITQCPVTVTDCPAHSTITTVEVVVTTTVCPVTDEPTGSFPPSFTPTGSFGTVTATPTTTKSAKPTTTGVQTAGAGRVVRGVEGVAALAGLIAAFL